MPQYILNLEYNVSLIYLDKYIDNYNLLLIINNSNDNTVYLGKVNYKKYKNLFSSNEELLNSLCRNENVEFIYDDNEFELINKNDCIHLQFENITYDKTFNINLENNNNVLDFFLSKLSYNFCILEKNNNKLLLIINNITLCFDYDELKIIDNKYLLESKIKNNILQNNNKIRELSYNLRNLKSENNLLEENMKHLFL
jgi:hypothetical protein